MKTIDMEIRNGYGNAYFCGTTFVWESRIGNYYSEEIIKPGTDCLTRVHKKLSILLDSIREKNNE